MYLQALDLTNKEGFQAIPRLQLVTNTLTCIWIHFLFVARSRSHEVRDRVHIGGSVLYCIVSVITCEVTGRCEAQKTVMDKNYSIFAILSENVTSFFFFFILNHNNFSGETKHFLTELPHSQYFCP